MSDDTSVCIHQLHKCATWNKRKGFVPARKSFHIKSYRTKRIETNSFDEINGMIIESAIKVFLVGFYEIIVKNKAKDQEGQTKHGYEQKSNSKPDAKNKTFFHHQDSLLVLKYISHSDNG